MVNQLDYPLPGPVRVDDNHLRAVAPLLAYDFSQQDVLEPEFFSSLLNIRVNICAIRSVLKLRTNRAALLMMMLMSARGNVLTYSTLLASLAPDAETDLLGKKLVRVYVHEIRERLRTMGWRDGLVLHRHAGYSCSRACIEAVALRLRSELRPR